jgi:hypothetical protein
MTEMNSSPNEQTMAAMDTKIERTLSGAFRTARLGADRWQLTTGAAPSAEIYLSGVDSDAFTALEGAAPSAVTVSWSAADTTVTLISPRASMQFKARTATIHEPRPQLYQGLPLVVLDAAARRFWRRVFFISRVPGARRVLGWIAQRTRGR